MGRLAHILRVALGRSYDLPPNWEELADQYEQVSSDPVLYRGIDPARSNAYGKLFDEKGRPFSQESKHLEREQAKAQNAALAIALSSSADGSVNFKDDPISLIETSMDGRKMASEEHRCAVHALADADNWATALENHVRLTVTWPFSTVAARSVIYTSSDVITIHQRVSTEMRRLGLRATAFPGFICGYVAFSISIVREKTQSQLWMLMAHSEIPTAVWNFSRALWIATSICIFSLTHYANLQGLHLIPSTDYLPTKLPLRLLFRSRLYTLGVFSTPLTSFIGTTVAHIFHHDIPTDDEDESSDADQKDDSLKTFLVQRTKKLALKAQRSANQAIERLMLIILGRPLYKGPMIRYPFYATRRTIVNILSRTLLFPLQDVLLRTIARTFLESAETPLQIENANWFMQLIFSPYPAISSIRSPSGYLRRMSICFCLWTSAELLVLSAQNQIWLWRYRAGCTK